MGEAIQVCGIKVGRRKNEVMRSDTSDYLFNFARTDARGAHVSVLDFSVFLDGDTLQVGQPATFRHIMGVADVVSRHRLFSAYCADSAHDSPPLHVSESII